MEVCNNGGKGKEVRVGAEILKFRTTPYKHVGNALA